MLRVEYHTIIPLFSLWIIFIIIGNLALSDDGPYCDEVTPSNARKEVHWHMASSLYRVFGFRVFEVYPCSKTVLQYPPSPISPLHGPVSVQIKVPGDGCPSGTGKSTI